MKKFVSLLLVIVTLVSLAVLPSSAMPRPYSYGDVLGDDDINILDATEIQRHLARFIELDDLRYELADFNKDGKRNLIDATDIQRYLANYMESVPRKDSFYALVKIDDVNFSKPSKRVDVKDEVVISVDASINYPIIETGPLKYDYTIVHIDSKTITTYEDCGSSFTYNFDKAGLYRIDVEVYDNYDGYDKLILHYQVMEDYTFDEFLYVYYDDKYSSDYKYNGKPEMPSDAIDYEILCCEDLTFDGSEKIKADCCNFASVITTKEQYDSIFDVELDGIDDEFFETNCIVGICTFLSSYGCEGKLDGLAVDGDTLYFEANEYLDLTAGMYPHPMEALWMFIAKVSKADVENVTDIEWTNSKFTIIE